MKKRILSFSLVLILFLLVIALSGCGSSRDQVPDIEIQRLVDAFASEAEISNYHWKAFHQIDKKAHTDTVLTTVISEQPYGTTVFAVPIVFRYNRASDLWSQYGSAEWEIKNIVLNKNIIKTWDFTRKDYGGYDNHLDYYSVTVTNISNDSISLSFNASIHVGGMWSETYCNLSGRGNASLSFSSNPENNYVVCEIEVPLPDGFSALDLDSRYKGTVSLFFYGSPEDGITGGNTGYDIIVENK